MADDEQVDPRFDPRFQRGYSGDASGGGRGDAVGGSRVGVPAPAPTSPSPRSSAQHAETERQRIAEPSDDELDEPQDALTDAQDVAVWTAARQDAMSSSRRWLTALWWIGALLLALGVLCLAYGIWANNDTAGQPYQDFWVSVYSSIAWQVYGPAMTIGLAALIGTGVLQVLAPGLRERR